MVAAENLPTLRILYSPSLEGSQLLRELRMRDGISVMGPGDRAPDLPEGLPTLCLVAPGDSPCDGLGPSSLVCLLGGSEEEAIREGWAYVPDPTLDALARVARVRWPFLPALAEAISKLRRDYDSQSLILDQLTEVSIALSAERDNSKLTQLILSRAILLAGCDAGSLYVRVPDNPEAPDKPPSLRFVAAQNNSVSFNFSEIEIPIDKGSLAGYVAATGQPLTIEDAYLLPEGAPYTFNPAFDRNTGYRTKSQLVLPMTNHRGDITGVLQLINKKLDPSHPIQGDADVEKQVVPFDAETIQLMRAVGSLAAVAIDNARLYENIERLFEGFVRASVTAIEQRDPTTSGHSLRVSILTVGLAECVDRTPAGPLSEYRFTPEQFRELRYASLLHDFGKVGVREQVLIKAKKLYPHELERILTRLELARLYREREILLERLREPGPHGDCTCAADDSVVQELDRFREVILRANEPTVLPEGDFSALREIASFVFQDREGKERVVLELEEASVLSIRKGSLSEQERREIESHVTHTWQFLKQIPWTRELRDIPNIAYGHHEKLNGKGYPRGIPEPVIPIQSKIMTVSDIFDALSAADRPYKKAVPVEKALDILKLEVKDGFLDPNLVDLFIEAKVFEKTLDLRAGARL